MAKIVRTPTRATGGITEREQQQMAELSKKWIANAMRTDTINVPAMTQAVLDLYAAASLKAPRVVIVPSPRVMAFAGGFAAAIWWLRKNPNADSTGTDAATHCATRVATYGAVYNAKCATARATDAATDDATFNATHNATHNATFNATHNATHANLAATRDAINDATDNATRIATLAVTDFSTTAATGGIIYNATHAATHAAIANKTISNMEDFMLQCASRWSSMYQAGNMMPAWDCYLAAYRDVLGLKLPQYEKYAVWEQCALNGGFRIMHEEFCIVSDFPEILKVDKDNRPHCEDGPSHRWRDGWELYYWHGVQVPEHVVNSPHTICAEDVRKEDNAEVRRIMIERMGWERFCSQAKMRVIHRDTLASSFPMLPVSETVHADMRMVTSYRAGEEVAELLECEEFKDFDDRPLKFVRVSDPSTGGQYLIRVWPENNRVYEAIAQTFAMTEAQYKQSVLQHS